jgi:hypothetical protein
MMAWSMDVTGVMCIEPSELVTELKKYLPEKNL